MQHFTYWFFFTCEFAVLRSLRPHSIITILRIFLSRSISCLLVVG